MDVIGHSDRSDEKQLHNLTRNVLSVPRKLHLFSITLISRMEVSASKVTAVSPLPLREDVPPKEVRVAAVKAEAARDP